MWVICAYSAATHSKSVAQIYCWPRQPRVGCRFFIMAALSRKAVVVKAKLKFLFINYWLAGVVLLCIFAISLAVRWDTFHNAPQGGAYYNTSYSRWTNTEVNTHVLYNIETYRYYPPARHFFASYFYAHDSRFMPSKYIESTVVYSSFPPTLFIAPYLIFKLLHVSTLSYTALKIFSLAIHFLCIGLVFVLVRTLLPRRHKYRDVIIPAFCASVYAFTTVTLHNHMAVYWSHQLLQPFFIGLLIRLTQTNGSLRLRELAIWSFLLAVITWTGFVACLGLILYFALQYWRHRQQRLLRYIATVAISAAAALALIVGQVLFVTGASIPAYFDTVANRVEARSFETGYVTPIQLIVTYVRDVAYDIGAYIFLALVLLVIFLAIAHRLPSFTKVQWMILWLATFPIIESIPLIEHDTVYGFGRLKLVLPLLLILCLVAGQLLAQWRWRTQAVILVALLFSIPAVIHVHIYQNIYGNGPQHTNYAQYVGSDRRFAR